MATWYVTKIFVQKLEDLGLSVVFIKIISFLAFGPLLLQLIIKLKILHQTVYKTPSSSRILRMHLISVEDF